MISRTWSPLCVALFIAAPTFAQAELLALAPADGPIVKGFGASVAIDGGLALVGAPIDGQFFQQAGAAYLFDLASGAQTHKLITLTADGVFGWLGWSVAMRDGLAVVGAPGAGGSKGEVRVFDAVSGQSLYVLKASDGNQLDRFGRSVAVGGGHVVVGAPNDVDDSGAPAGSVYVFDAATGAELYKLTPDLFPGGKPFGDSVAIDGGRIVSGALDATAGVGAGAVYVFDAASGQPLLKLIAADASPGAYLGTSVAISGSRVVAGAPSAGGPGPSSGAVYVFDASTGQQLNKLTSPNPAIDIGFGARVAFDGYRIVVKAGKASSSASSVYVFDVSTGHALYELVATGPVASMGWGSSVGISGDRAIVGAGGAQPIADAAHVFDVPQPGVEIAFAVGLDAQSAGTSAVTGSNLHLVTQAFVGAATVPIVAQSASNLTLQLAPADPGFHDLVLVHPSGVASAAEVIERWPSAEARASGIGGVVRIELDNGSHGLYVLGYAVGLLSAPIVVPSPPTWGGLLLDVTGPHAILATGAFTSAAAIQLAYPVPPDPTLTGLTLHVQAWCQQGFFGSGVTYSFTNVATVTI